jgi:hypothetical protein
VIFFCVQAWKDTKMISPAGTIKCVHIGVNNAEYWRCDERDFPPNTKQRDHNCKRGGAQGKRGEGSEGAHEEREQTEMIENRQQ